MDNSDDDIRPLSPLPSLAPKRKASAPSFIYEISDDEPNETFNESPQADTSNRPSFDFMSTIEKYKNLKEQWENGENIGSYACYFTQFGDSRKPSKARKTPMEKAVAAREDPDNGNAKKKSWPKKWINKYRKGRK